MYKLDALLLKQRKFPVLDITGFFYRIRIRVKDMVLRRKKKPLNPIQTAYLCFNNTVSYTYNHFTWTVDYRTYNLWPLCDRWQPLLSYWCPYNHESKGSMQGKKGIIGKENWCLRSRWTFWCWSHRLRVCVCGGGGVGYVTLKSMLWALEICL